MLLYALPTKSDPASIILIVTPAQPSTASQDVRSVEIIKYVVFLREQDGPGFVHQFSSYPILGSRRPCSLASRHVSPPGLYKYKKSPQDCISGRKWSIW